MFSWIYFWIGIIIFDEMNKHFFFRERSLIMLLLEHICYLLEMKVHTNKMIRAIRAILRNLISEFHDDVLASKRVSNLLVRIYNCETKAAQQFLRNFKM